MFFQVATQVHNMSPSTLSSLFILAVMVAIDSVLASGTGARFQVIPVPHDKPLAGRALRLAQGTDDAHWTTIDGKQYPKDVGPDAPAPIITSNWWLDEVQKNDTTIHKFSYSDLPLTSQAGQTGTNRCSGLNHDASMCQTLLLNGADDFCLWGPPTAGQPVSTTEEIEVAWCTKHHGARQIPDGTLTSIHFVSTPAYLQVTGTGDLTRINIQQDDQGGELDPHGATGNGNPIGGLVYTTAWNAKGHHEQINEWMMEISSTSYCFRGCKGTDADSQMLCTHIYDEMGCDFIMPASSEEGIFETCQGDTALAPGIISTWTFTQGDPVTPSPRHRPASSQCTPMATSIPSSSSSNPPSPTYSSLSANAAAAVLKPGSQTTSRASSLSMYSSVIRAGLAGLTLLVAVILI